MRCFSIILAIIATATLADAGALDIIRDLIGRTPVVLQTMADCFGGLMTEAPKEMADLRKVHVCAYEHMGWIHGNSIDIEKLKMGLQNVPMFGEILGQKVDECAHFANDKHAYFDCINPFKNLPDPFKAAAAAKALMSRRMLYR